jgi:SpoVK/Ycf46/Vps4 family AAA+-type ATPase
MTQQPTSSFDVNSMCMIVTTMIASYLMEKFNFGAMHYGMMHGLILQLISWILFKNFDIDMSYIYYLIYVIPFICFSYIIYYVWNMRKTREQNNYITINFCDEDVLQNFILYVKQNKQYYEIMISTNAGDIDKLHQLQLYMSDSNCNITMKNMLLREASLISQMIDTKIIFNDPYLQAKGYYTWRKSEKRVSDNEGKNTRDITIKYIGFNILKEENKIVDPLDIIDKVNNYVDDLNKDQIELRYIKVLQTNKDTYNHVVTFYKGKKEPFEQLETKFIKSLFHPEKDRLWTMVKNSCLNQHLYKDKGQCGRVSLLLYGPPGTGKSTFAYRIAMCMQRQIISLDLRDLDKQTLYQILHNPTRNYCKSYKDAVYLFEEIDASIKELYLRGKKQESAKSEYESRMMRYYGDSSMCYKSMNNNTVNQYIIKDGNSDTDTGKKSNNLDKVNESQKDQKDTDNITEKYTKRYDEISKLTKSRNEFNIRDLLEVFQGPIPFEEMIIIANTNKFDEIKKLCPELFRPGRLTPVYFGYINKDTLQDISKYYFNKKIDGYLPETIKIPTSQIIELALETSQYKYDQFDQFSIQLNKLIDEIKD